MFDIKFFAKYQWLLLKIANTKLGRVLFSINGKKSAVGKNKIIAITPNAIFWTNENEYIAGFRANNQFSQVIEKLLYPLHLWDTLIANKVVPSLNLGFDSLTKNPTAGGNGRLISTDKATFALAHSASIANADATDLFGYRASNDSNLQRGCGVFDTSAIGSGAIVSAWKLRVYRDDVLATFGDADTTTVVVVPTSQANANSLSGADWGTYVFSNKGSLALGSTTDGAYNEIDGTDMTFISVAGNTKVGLICGRDLTNTTPTGLNEVAFQTVAGANKPELVVTYTIPPSTGFMTILSM